MSNLYDYKITLVDDLVRVENKEGQFFERELFACERGWTTLAQLIKELNSDVDLTKE